MRTRRIQSVLLALSVFSLISCASKHLVAPPPPVDSIIGSDRSSLQESLFRGDQAVLSNQDIERILTARLSLADRHRLAVLQLSHYSFWSPLVADMEGKIAERFLEDLRRAPQLTQVRFVPRLLVPEKRTVPYLREAAARFQADLLLVYVTRVETFEQTRLLGTDEVRARCVVESVLLDVRTGIVAHTARGEEGVHARKTPGDLNFAETVAKARAEAAGKALTQVAESMVAYLRDAAK